MFETILLYLRTVSYVLVIFLSLVVAIDRKGQRVVGFLIANAGMALVLFIMNMAALTNNEFTWMRHFLLTPIVILWSITTFYLNYKHDRK